MYNVLRHNLSYPIHTELKQTLIKVQQTENIYVAVG